MLLDEEHIASGLDVHHIAPATAIENVTSGVAARNKRRAHRRGEGAGRGELQKEVRNESEESAGKTFRVSHTSCPPSSPLFQPNSRERASETEDGDLFLPEGKSTGWVSAADRNGSPLKRGAGAPLTWTTERGGELGGDGQAGLLKSPRDPETTWTTPAPGFTKSTTMPSGGERKLMMANERIAKPVADHGVLIDKEDRTNEWSFGDDDSDNNNENDGGEREMVGISFTSKNSGKSQGGSLGGAKEGNGGGAGVSLKDHGKSIVNAIDSFVQRLANAGMSYQCVVVWRCRCYYYFSHSENFKVANEICCRYFD